MPWQLMTDPRALLEARLARAWPSHIASARSGVSRSRILHLERYAEEPDCEELRKLARAYKVPVERLTHYVEVPRPRGQSRDPNRSRFFAKGRPHDHAAIPEQSAKRRDRRRAPDTSLEDW
jgi:transcriptional regulator with XRE-family HTH domain